MLVWAAAWILVAVGVTAIVVDLGRLFVVREQVQTAVDAGSLAGSHQSVRSVKVRVPERKKTTWEICKTCNKNGKCKTQACNYKTVSLPDSITEGTQKEVWEQKKCLIEAGCGSCGTRCNISCGEPKIEDQWVIFKSDAESIARSIIETNLPEDVRSNQGGKVTSETVQIHTGTAEKGSSHYDPLAPSVVAKVKGTVSSLLSGMLWGETDLPVGRCGVSGVFFPKLSNDGSATNTHNQRPQIGCP